MPFFCSVPSRAAGGVVIFDQKLGNQFKSAKPTRVVYGRELRARLIMQRDDDRNCKGPGLIIHSPHNVGLYADDLDAIEEGMHADHARCQLAPERAL
eukprot:5969668-Pyramimonas_sp.AAC.1